MSSIRAIDFDITKKSAFHLCGKTGCSGGKSNGTGLSTGNFSEKKECLQRYSSFPVSPGMTGKFLFHLQQPVCSLIEQGRQVTQRTLKCTVESIQINPKFLSSVDRGRHKQREIFPLNFLQGFMKTEDSVEKFHPRSPFSFCDPGSRSAIRMEFSKGTPSFRSVYVLKNLYRSICRKILTENSM